MRRARRRHAHAERHESGVAKRARAPPASTIGTRTASPSSVRAAVVDQPALGVRDGVLSLGVRAVLDCIDGVEQVVDHAPAQHRDAAVDERARKRVLGIEAAAQLGERARAVVPVRTEREWP